MNAGIASKRLLGGTCNLIINGKINNLETITEVLYIMARSRYNPQEQEADAAFMQTVAELYVKEPGKIKLAMIPKAIWSFYAIGHKHKGVLDKFSETIVTDHMHLHMDDAVSIMKAWAYFGYLNLDARDAVVKTVIRNSDEYNF